MKIRRKKGAIALLLAIVLLFGLMPAYAVEPTANLAMSLDDSTNGIDIAEGEPDVIGTENGGINAGSVYSNVQPMFFSSLEYNETTDVKLLSEFCEEYGVTIVTSGGALNVTALEKDEITVRVTDIQDNCANLTRGEQTATVYWIVDNYGVYVDEDDLLWNLSELGFVFPEPEGAIALRYLAEKYNFEVSWDQNTQQVTIVKDGLTAASNPVTSESATLSVGGQTSEPIFWLIFIGRTYVFENELMMTLSDLGFNFPGPEGMVVLRVLCDRLGIQVGWNSSTGQVTLTRNGLTATSRSIDNEHATLTVGRQTSGSISWIIFAGRTYVYENELIAALRSLSLLPASTTGSSQSSSSSSEPSSPSATATAGTGSTVVTGNTVTTSATVKDNITSATVSRQNVNTALQNALTAARGNSVTQVVINIPAAENTATVEVTIPRDAFSLVTDSGAALTLKEGDVTLSFSADALNGIDGAVGGDVTIISGLADKDSLTQVQRDEIGDRPVYNFSVISQDTYITNFNGNVSVSLPYTLQPGENHNSIVIYYVDGVGKLKTITNCKYDSASGQIVFTTDHFSIYMIGYNRVAFSDVSATHWAVNAVEQAASRGLVTGMGDGKYDPSRSVTRAEFIQMMYTLLELSRPTVTDADYPDVINGAWYAPSVIAAKKAGLLNGIVLEDNLFLPNQAITREEIAVILGNALKYKKITVPGDAPSVDGLFTDAGDMNEYAKTHIATVADFGVMKGMTGGAFAPKSPTTRAQAAQVLIQMLKVLW